VRPKLGSIKFASVVGIATVYGLDGPEIESLCWRDIPHLSIVALGPTQPPIPQVPGLSRGYSGRFVALTTHYHLAPRVKSTAIPLLPTVGLHSLFYGELALYPLIRHLCRIAKSDRYIRHVCRLFLRAKNWYNYCMQKETNRKLLKDGSLKYTNHTTYFTKQCQVVEETQQL